MAARQRGARALLVVTGPRSPNAGELVPMTFDTALAGSGIPAASISGSVADALFAPVKPLRDIQQELDSGNPHVAGFDLAGRHADPHKHRSSVNATPRATSSRICRRRRPSLPPTNRGSSSAPTTTISAAAAGATRWRPRKQASAIHHGADDNASGTAAVLAIAEAARQVAAAPARATS